MAVRPDPGLKAIATIEGETVKGKIVFEQFRANQALKIYGEISGLTHGEHGMHVHEFGDVTSGCSSAGAHFNPHNKNHGGLDSEERHVGDLGVVNFEQRTPKTPLRISGRIQGLPPGKHGLTIHEYGDLSKGWRSTGNHFNPLKKEHGGLEDKIRHLGDLGNVEVNEDGIGTIDLTDKSLSLSGHNSVLGRSLVIHELADDLGKGSGKSKRTGNSGNGVAAGVIGIQKL